MRVSVIGLVLFIFTTVPAFSATIRVDHSGGGDYLTIQEGVSAAGERDTVLVAPGTYTGPGNRTINFDGTNIVLVSESGAENTIVDCEALDVAVKMYSGEDSTSVISGFTITNGQGSNGGGIRVSGASPIIEDCIFSGNRASNGGGVYYGYVTSPGAIRNCVFLGNTASFRGGGLECDTCDPPNEPRVTNCVFYNNEAGTVGSHGGGGIYCNSSPITITGCTLAGNSGGPGAGGIFGYGWNLTVARTVVAFSTEGVGMSGVYPVDHCVIFGNAGGDSLGGQQDNLYQDPLFCGNDNPAEPYTLHSNSPCLPENNVWNELIGVYGAGCASPVEMTGWSDFKSLFRD